MLERLRMPSVPVVAVGSQTQTQTRPLQPQQKKWRDQMLLKVQLRERHDSSNDRLTSPVEANMDNKEFILALSPVRASRYAVASVVCALWQ